MRWFKHMTNARHDAFLKELRHEFGADGFMIWWCLVEYVAEALKESNPKPHILATPKAFAEECFSTEEMVENVIRFAARAVPSAKAKFRKRGRKWSVEIPKVLEFRDEHSRKQGVGLRSHSGVTPEQLAQIRTDQKQKKNQRRVPSAPPNGAMGTAPQTPNQISSCPSCRGLGMVSARGRAVPCTECRP